MGFSQYTWSDRNTQYPNRRVLTYVDSNTTETVDVSRDEGAGYNKPTEEVVEFNADNMNDLESRIAAAFSAIATKRATLLNTIYPVGSIYISMDNTSPATVLGGGTWQSISGGILLPSNNCNLTPQGSDTSSYKPTGNVSYSLRCETGYAELPAHKHPFTTLTDVFVTSWGAIQDGSGSHSAPSMVDVSASGTTNPAGSGGGHSHNLSVNASFTGNTQTFNNMMPSITVYAWRRTA